MSDQNPHLGDTHHSQSPVGCPTPPPLGLDIDRCIIIGLLQVAEYAENFRPAGMVSYIHKSIQEFLAAWFVTYRCVPEGNLGGIEQHFRTFEDCEALENVFQFVCGLSDNGAVKVFQHLTLALN